MGEFQEWLLSLNAQNVELFYSYQLRALGLFLFAVWLLKLFDTSARCRQSILKVIILATVLLPLTTLLMPQVQLQIPVNTRDLSASNPVFSSPDNVTLLAFVLNAMFIAYIAVSALLLLRQLAAVLIIWLITYLGRSHTQSAWSSTLHHIQQQLTIQRPVSIVFSSHIQSPMVWGWIRPTILVPQQAIAWEDSLIRATLLHELHHIKRNDWIFHQLMHIVAALYWINPLVWTLSRQLNDNAETICDESVVESGVENTDYASKLLRVARQLQQQMQRYAVGMAINHHQSQLSQRIQAILSPEPLLNPSKLQVSVFSLLVLFVCLPLLSLKADITTVYVPAPYSAPFFQTPQLANSQEQQLDKDNLPTAHQGNPTDVPVPVTLSLRQQYLTRAKNYQDLHHPTDANILREAHYNISAFKPADDTIEIFTPRYNTTRTTAKIEPVKPNRFGTTIPTMESQDDNPWADKRVVKPKYPRNALKRGIEGEVVVQFAVDKEGAVIESKILQASPKGVFDRHVLKAIQQSYYQPRRENASRAAVHYGTEVYKFVIES